MATDTEATRMLDIITEKGSARDDEGDLIVDAHTLNREWAKRNNVTDGAARDSMEEAVETMLGLKDAMSALNQAYEHARLAICKAESQALGSDNLTALLAKVLDDPAVAALPQAAQWRMQAAVKLIRR